MDNKSRKLLDEKIEWVEKQGYGEITIKIKNGYVYRLVWQVDELLECSTPVGVVLDKSQRL